MTEIFNRSLAILVAGVFTASLLIASFSPPAPTAGLITLI